MNCTRLFLTQFRIYEATKTFQSHSKLENLNYDGFKNNLNKIKINQENYKDFTPIFGLNKSKSSMFLGASLFFAVFVICNLLILLYYCYRIRKLKQEDPEYSIQSLHND